MLGTLLTVFQLCIVFKTAICHGKIDIKRGFEIRYFPLIYYVFSALSKMSVIKVVQYDILRVFSHHLLKYLSRN